MDFSLIQRIDLFSIISLVLISIVFLLNTCFVFHKKWASFEKLPFCIFTFLDSPLSFVLLSQLFDKGLKMVLQNIGIRPTESLFLVFIITFETLFNMALLFLASNIYHKLTRVNKIFNIIIYFSFMSVSVVTINIPNGLYQISTALFLLAVLIYFLYPEFKFMVEYDTELYYHTFLTPIIFFLLIILGILNIPAIFTFPNGQSQEMLESSYGWTCVFSVMITLMTFLTEKNLIRGMRETYEAEASAVKIMKLNKDLVDTQDKLIQQFSEILESKSGESGKHVQRVAEYSALLARELAVEKHLSDEDIHTIKIAAMMHDCGKLLIPNEILEKPGKLTPEEFEVMKKHVDFGEKMLKEVPGRIMEEALLVASQHHERWDGKGYTRHLKGDEISLSSQIVAVADVFDALTNERCYKKAWPLENAYDEIISKRGTQFSPRVIDAFTRCYDKCVEIYDVYHD